MAPTHGYSEPHFYPATVDSITVVFGDEISNEINDRVISLANALDSDASITPEDNWILNLVPAYASLTVYFDRYALPDPKRRSPHDVVTERIKRVLKRCSEERLVHPRTHEVPVSFDAEHSLDSAVVSEISGFEFEHFIERFTADTYRVFLLGFLPGFPYLGIVDDEIAVPRKSAPRNLVPAGSVGIAGNQTGIYPFDSPGGWQIIGKTDLNIFQSDDENPALFAPGDFVRFKKA